MIISAVRIGLPPQLDSLPRWSTAYCLQITNLEPTTVTLRVSARFTLPHNANPHPIVTTASTGDYSPEPTTRDGTSLAAAGTLTLDAGASTIWTMSSDGTNIELAGAVALATVAPPAVGTTRALAPQVSLLLHATQRTARGPYPTGAAVINGSPIPGVLMGDGYCSETVPLTAATAQVTVGGDIGDLPTTIHGGIRPSQPELRRAVTRH